MDHKTRRQVEKAACDRRYDIADAKGAEYSGAGTTYQKTGADTLANFKKVGERLGISPVQVLLTYMLKHMDSITTAVREAEAIDPDDPLDLEYKRVKRYAAGEGIVSRLDDLRNYADLAECLMIDTGAISGRVLDPEYRAKNKGVDVDRWIPDASVPTEEQSQLMEQYNHENEVTPEEEETLKNAGLVKGLDGVYRGPSKIDESVAPNALRETPICLQAQAQRKGGAG